jgi:hypothetical protein
MTTPGSRVEYATHPATNPADPLAIALADLLNQMAGQGWRYTGTADGQHIFERPRQAEQPRER